MHGTLENVDAKNAGFANHLGRIPQDRALPDLIIIILVIFVIAGVFIEFDFFGTFLQIHHTHDSSLIDELFIASNVASLAIAWFSYRRWRDSQQANKIRKAMESDRNTLREQLLQTQKMKAVGELAGGIAHDFNNILMVIDGFGRRALDYLNDPAIMETSLNQIITASERGATLTRQMLVFSRRQAMEQRVVTVNDLLDGVRGLLEHSLPDTFEIRFDIDNPNNKIETDPNAFIQAFLNLVINARDAMTNGGRIVISTKKIVSETDGTAWIRFDVRDTGHGMDEATLERIFEPFFTTKERLQGTGLGLAMVYGFVQGDGGRIEVESAPGKGTVFSLYFQKTDDAVSLIEKTGIDVPKGQGETVLLVEDNEALLDLIRSQLEELDYNVLTANGGFWALEVDEDYVGDIDVLMTDVMMPGMRGIELAEALADKRPEMKVIFMSAYTGEPSETGKLPQGATLLQKPMTIDRVATELRKKIEQHLVN